MLSIESVTKKYRTGTVAVDNVSLQLNPGIVGLLGPNGAGKTSLMHMIATLTRPTGGQILYRGSNITREPEVIRAHLGYLPQDFGLYENATAFEFLRYLGGIKGVRSRSRIMEVLEAVNLHSVAHQRVKTFSGGMKQRLGIAQALVNDPDLLIVDEPTAGLDLEERIRFRNLIMTLSRTSLVILSTHIVSDVAATAGMIALLKRGKILTYAPPGEILASASGHVWEASISASEYEQLAGRLLMSSAVQRVDHVDVRVVAEESPFPAASPVEPTLEDAYLYLKGNDRTA
jgi:ABC-2 type transport system ATP-binding protein